MSDMLSNWQAAILAIERSIEQKKLQTKKLENDLIEEESEEDDMDLLLRSSLMGSVGGRKSGDAEEAAKRIAKDDERQARIDMEYEKHRKASAEKGVVIEKVEDTPYLAGWHLG